MSNFSQFMAVCHPSIPTHIVRANRNGNMRRVSNPTYYSGIHRQQFSIAQKYATSSLENFEVAIADANKRLETSNDKIRELSSRVSSLESKREKTEVLLRETHEMLEHDGKVISSLKNHICCLEQSRTEVVDRIAEWRAKVSGFLPLDTSDTRWQDFTEEWHTGPQGTVYFVNPKTDEVIDPTISTLPVIGVRRGDIESGFSLESV